MFKNAEPEAKSIDNEKKGKRNTRAAAVEIEYKDGDNEDKSRDKKEQPENRIDLAGSSPFVLVIESLEEYPSACWILACIHRQCHKSLTNTNRAKSNRE